MKLRIFTEPQQGATYDDLLTFAQATERLGFDAFFRSDHYQRMGDGDPGPGPTDAWITLAGLARETSSIRLGTLVSAATFRLPGPLAISVAQVDQMSGGRIELGLGTGWFDLEHTSYGIPFPPLGERFGRFEEQLEIITGLWTAEKDYSFEGSYYRLADSPALPKPVQRPRPPVIIGGAGAKRTPRLAATYADEYNVPFHSPDETAEAFGRVRRASEETGRNLTYSFAQVTVVGADEAEFQRRAAAIGQSADELRARGLCGTPAEVIEKIGAYGEIGAERAYLQVLDLSDLDHLELIAAEILPHV
ncbi:LLM class F420-dependent oxidoreductase [Nonomuraea maritima]|uniref:LLM class F420-dependent oxidoreductase n=1 Tax=Nonomuraea maritima TaxID=683260 RepID=UPI0037213E36